MYVIVNAASGRPIHAIGFRATYEHKEEAERVAASWNAHRSLSICAVKVIDTRPKEAHTHEANPH